MVKAVSAFLSRIFFVVKSAAHYFAVVCRSASLIGSGAAPHFIGDDDGFGNAPIFGSRKSPSPAGTAVTVRLASAVGSKLSANGDHFSATVATPVQVDGKVLIPAGAEALGKVVEAVPQGRFKGAAALRLVLESVSVNGDSYDV
jgi:hypothetical protein